MCQMRRSEALARLRALLPVLRERFGVSQVSLFGSVVRDEARADSDVDVLVEFEEPVGLFSLVAVQGLLTDEFGCPVDVGTEASLKPRVLARAKSEAVVVG